MSIVMDEVLQSDQGERVRDSPMAMDPVEAKKEIEFQNAKAYMLTNSNTSGLNLSVNTTLCFNNYLLNIYNIILIIVFTADTIILPKY